MAAPVDSARQGTNITTAATSHAINVGSPVAGTLLIVMVRFAAAPGTVTFTGYTQFAADTSDASDDDTRLYYRQADGAEGATDTLSTVNSVKLAAICWEITGAENPATIAPIVSTVAIGTAANINPGIVYGPIDFTGVASTGTFPVQGTGGSNESVAQSFVATSSSITRVSLKLSKAASPTDNLLIDLQSDSSGSPSGSSVGSVGSIAGASLTTTATVTDFDCSISVSNGVTYWIVCTRSGSRDTTNYFVASSTSANPYANGQIKFQASGSWSSSAVSDLNFRVVGAALDCLFLTVIGLDSETATATEPAGYSNLASANSGTGGAVATNCMIWGASKAATATSDDPGAWTSSAPNSGVTAWTIAIPPPAAAAAPGPASSRRRRQASRFLTFR